MHRRDTIEIRSWMLFALAAVIVVPISVGFALGGPTIGLLIALAVAVAIVVVAIRQDPRRMARRRDQRGPSPASARAPRELRPGSRSIRSSTMNSAPAVVSEARVPPAAVARCSTS